MEPRDRPNRAEVRALSPSEAADIAMIFRFGEAAGQASATTLCRRLPNIVDNHASVVISVVAGDARVLLGSDLLVRGDRNFGWFAIHDFRMQTGIKPTRLHTMDRPMLIMTTSGKNCFSRTPSPL